MVLGPDLTTLLARVYGSYNSPRRPRDPRNVVPRDCVYIE